MLARHFYYFHYINNVDLYGNSKKCVAYKIAWTKVPENWKRAFIGKINEVLELNLTTESNITREIQEYYDNEYMPDEEDQAEAYQASSEIDALFH